MKFLLYSRTEKYLLIILSAHNHFCNKISEQLIVYKNFIFKIYKNQFSINFL